MGKLCNFGHLESQFVVVNCASLVNQCLQLLCWPRHDAVYCCYWCSGPVASRLLQVKMNILPHETCRHLNKNNTLLNETAHICVGSIPTRDRGPCSVGYLRDFFIMVIIGNTQNFHYTSNLVCRWATSYPSIVRTWGVWGACGRDFDMKKWHKWSALHHTLSTINDFLLLVNTLNVNKHKKA